jgi:hypothetical protein
MGKKSAEEATKALYALTEAIKSLERHAEEEASPETNSVAAAIREAGVDIADSLDSIAEAIAKLGADKNTENKD